MFYIRKQKQESSEDPGVGAACTAFWGAMVEEKREDTCGRRKAEKPTVMMSGVRRKQKSSGLEKFAPKKKNPVVPDPNWRPNWEVQRRYEGNIHNSAKKTILTPPRYMGEGRSDFRRRSINSLQVVVPKKCNLRAPATLTKPLHRHNCSEGT